MRTIPLLLLVVATLAPAAKADRFWLENPDKNPDGSAVIDGVLLGEDPKQYHIRVVGGELWLDKVRVAKVEKTMLTVDEVLKAEAASAQKQALAEAERHNAQTATIAAATASRRSRAEAVPATFDDAAPPAPVAAPVPAEEMIYSPAIRALVPAYPAGNRYAVMMDLELAYAATRDRTYLKLLRKVRRLE